MKRGGGVCRTESELAQPCVVCSEPLGSVGMSVRSPAGWVAHMQCLQDLHAAIASADALRGCGVVDLWTSREGTEGPAGGVA
jgi:hypothetical protein